MATRKRVVFIPGVLGTVLIDSSLTPRQAQQECVKNLGRLGWVLKGSALYPCNKRPEMLWGGVGSLHWLFDPRSWESRMKRGNGLDVPGAVRPGGLFDVDIRFRRVRLQVRPYAQFLTALRRAGYDVLEFPYDWRLSARANVELLHRQVRRKWFANDRRDDPPSELRKVSLIGHSMGGLIARLFVEGSPARRELVGRVITIGTPHLGSPTAYLHFAGITLPFPENPFYRGLDALLAPARAAAGLAAPGGATAQLLPGPTQTAVFKHMASAIELMPTRDFVTVKGRAEPWAETYRDQVHTGSGTPAMGIIRELRRVMIDERQLDSWLRQHRIEYHFLAATGFQTVSGYERDGRRIRTTTAGDGTVTVSSAMVAPRSTQHLRVRVVSGGSFGHQRLCERTDVQDYCLRAIDSRTGSLPMSPAGGPGGPSEPQPPPLTADFVAMARRILGTQRGRPGVVLSVAHLISSDGSPLVRTEVDPPVGGSRRPRLRQPPRHLASPELHDVESPNHGTFQYAWMSPHKDARFPVGGIMFVPKRVGASTGDPVDLHLVTFNTGRLDIRYKTRCWNAHHAETQLINWIEEQPISFRARIGTLRLANRSRWGDSRGYSPCTGCCADLARFLRNLTALRGGRPIVTHMSWQELYGGRDCSSTDAACVASLRDSGWGEPQGPRPPGAAPLPPRDPSQPRPGPIRRPAPKVRTAGRVPISMRSG